MSFGRTQTFRPNVGKDVEHPKLLFIADAIDVGNSLTLFGKDEGAHMNFTLMNISQRNFCMWIAELYKDNSTLCKNK